MSEIRSESFHDFNKERLLLNVLGGHVILRKPSYLHVMNLGLLVSLLILYVYMLSMCLVTMVQVADDDTILVQNSHTIFLMIICVTAPLLKQNASSSLERVLESFKDGLYSYDVVYDLEQEEKMKKKRVKQIRWLSATVIKLAYSSFFGYLIQLPLIRVFISDGSSADSTHINPYLPLPIYMPFDTTNAFGYTVAFATMALFLVFFFAAITSLELAYFSVALQLIAQLDILNYSISQIEKRAYRRFQTEYLTKSEDESEIDKLYGSWAFQRCLYLSLRENIKHHQAILRCTKDIKKYTDPVNALCVFVFSYIFATSLVLLIKNPLANTSLLFLMIAEFFGYLQICYIGQLITDQSAEIVKALYSTPWPKCRKSFRVLLNVMLLKGQKPIVFTATGIQLDSSLETFGDMITIAYKLLNLILK